MTRLTKTEYQQLRHSMDFAFHLLYVTTAAI